MAARGGGRCRLSAHASACFGFQEIVREIAKMVRRMVQGIPAHLLEYLGRFLGGNSLKAALQDAPIGGTALRCGRGEVLPVGTLASFCWLGREREGNGLTHGSPCPGVFEQVPGAPPWNQSFEKRAPRRTIWRPPPRARKGSSCWGLCELLLAWAGVGGGRVPDLL